MDRLVLEPEIEIEKEIKTEIHEEEKQEEVSATEPATERQVAPQESQKPSYVDSFSGMTLADIKNQKEDEELAKFQSEKEKLRKQQFSEPTKENESEKIIEKPNYDLIEEGKTKYKISVNRQTKAQKNQKPQASP